MDRLTHKKINKELRAKRVRKTVSGTTDRPRLSVKISNRHISAQLIDDSKHNTLVAITSVGQKTVAGTMTDKAAWVGSTLAKKALNKKIKKVVLDRRNKLYHGRVHALANAAREAGLEF